MEIALIKHLTYLIFEVDIVKYAHTFPFSGMKKYQKNFCGYIVETS